MGGKGAKGEAFRTELNVLQMDKFSRREYLKYFSVCPLSRPFPLSSLNIPLSPSSLFLFSIDTTPHSTSYPTQTTSILTNTPQWLCLYIPVLVDTYAIKLPAQLDSFQLEVT